MYTNTTGVINEDLIVIGLPRHNTCTCRCPVKVNAGFHWMENIDLSEYSAAYEKLVGDDNAFIYEPKTYEPLLRTQLSRYSV